MEIMKLFDNEKTEYYLVEDIIISKKKCIEIWENINEGNEYELEYYGLNIPTIGLNYKIVALGYSK